MTLRVPVLVKPGEPQRRSDNGAIDGVRTYKPESIEEMRALFTEMMGLGASSKTQEDIEKEQRSVRFAADMADLKERFIKGDADAIKNAVQRSMMELRSEDPMFPGGVPTPGDFLAEFPIPLDTTELITMCDETTLWRSLPEVTDDRNVVSWRELNELDFVSGCDEIAFQKGDCPNDFEHDGDNLSVALKHIGAEKSLTDSDILASRWSIGRGYGMRELVGGFGPGENGQRPGEGDVASFIRGNIADLREKEMRLASVLTMNGWDDLLVNGDATGNPLEFNGLVNYVTADNGAHANGGTTTGTFSQSHFDQFVASGCAYPDMLVGHPTALLAIANAYFQAGTQTIFYDRNERITPGFSFGNEIMTAFGALRLVADRRFPVTNNGDGTITSTVYPLLSRHNGENLVYKQTQIPLSFKDLAPGCTAIKFIIWAVTCLVVKAMCAQSLYTARFSGIVDDSCSTIHPCST